jgi:hypothetical protein
VSKFGVLGQGKQLLADLPAIRLASTGGSVSPTGHLLADYRVLH